jgi:hypothetical protein
VPAWKRWSPILLRPEGLYGTRPAEGGNKAAKLRAIREALRTARRVWLATDCDREGQLIGQEILEHYEYRGQVMRVLFTAQDSQTIRNAFGRAKPNSEYARLYAAAVARRQADQIPGPFSLASERRMQRILADAGFQSVMLEPRDFDLDIACGGGIEEALEAAMALGPQAAPCRTRARKRVPRSPRRFAARCNPINAVSRSHLPGQSGWSPRTTPWRRSVPGHRFSEKSVLEIIADGRIGIAHRSPRDVMRRTVEGRGLGVVGRVDRWRARCARDGRRVRHRCRATTGLTPRNGLTFVETIRLLLANRIRSRPGWRVRQRQPRAAAVRPLLNGCFPGFL